MKHALTAFATAAALLLASAAHAQVYKCVGAGGKTVYSETPCPSGSASSTLRAPPPASAAKQSSPAEAEAAFRKRQAEQKKAEEKAGQQAAEADAKAQNCRSARENLAQYEAGGRVVKFDQNGERRYLDDAEIAQEKAKAQGLIQQWCK